MKTYSTYQLDSGIFTGNSIGCTAAFLAANIPDGQGCIMGEYDHLSERVDMSTGEVIDYIPPQPSPDYGWDTSSRRWIYVPTLFDKKTAKLIEINQRCSALLGAVMSGYPPDEVQSWSKQESEARALAINSGAPTPLLHALAVARAIPLSDLVAKVIAKADLFAAASGTIIGQRQHCEDLIAAAATADDVAAIAWPLPAQP